MPMSPRLHRALLVLLVLPAACSSSGAPADASSSTPPPPEGGATVGAAAPAAGTTARFPEGAIYREEQAERGRQVFRESCSSCHYSSEMQGTQFQFQWGRRTVEDLYEHLVKTMPEDAPGTLSPSAYVDVVSYILRLNGFEAGAAELRTDDPSFQVRLAAPSGTR